MSGQALTSTGKVAFSDLGETDASRCDSLMRQYGSALRGYFASRVRNPADVDDLVQEVFVQLLRRTGGDPIEHARHYLFQVASNVLCDYGRKMKVRHHDQHESFDEVLHGLSTDISPERIAMGRESVERVMAALESLSPRTRDIFILRGVRQLKHEEVSHMLGVSTRVVHEHMGKAIRHLSKVFGESQ